MPIDTTYTCTNCGGKHEMLEPCAKSIIKALRKQLRLTQVEFAELLGTTQMTISTWENGKCPDYIENLAKMVLGESANAEKALKTQA